MSDLLTRIRFHCENGTSPYDDVMALNAQLNRKSVRQPPEQVIELLVSGLTAIIDGCCVWCEKNNKSGGAAASSSSSSEFDPVKVVLSSVAPLIKTWQNAAMPGFISACAAPGASNDILPAALHRLLLALSPNLKRPDEQQQQEGEAGGATSEGRAVLAVPLAVERFHFAVKFVHESATKALSCHALRKARAIAQVEGVDAYLAAAEPLVGQAAGSGSEAQSMALSAHMWLAQQLFEQQVMKEHEIDEGLWGRCVMLALRLLARKSVTAAACPSEAEFRRLPTVEQARCLVLLAHGGVSRAVPVAVLFRRLAMLGFSGAKPEFMLLNGFGLLSEAPATSSRDQAAKKLVAVYFTEKPAAPLAAETALKEVVEKFVSECFTQRGNEVATAAAN